ncbi:hypothetical protein KC350_g19381, partial [Hortaea werneckii]
MAGSGNDASNTSKGATETKTDTAANGHAASEANGSLINGAADESEKKDGEGEGEDVAPAESVFKLTVKLPHEPYQTEIMVSTQEQVQDIRQSIVDTPNTFQYSCFHLEHKGERINDFIELSEVKDIVQEPLLVLKEDPYTEAQARMHVV